MERVGKGRHRKNIMSNDDEMMQLGDVEPVRSHQRGIETRARTAAQSRGVEMRR